MKRNLLKCILWVLLLAGCFPLLAVAGAQQKEQRYKIAVCDWMILKRQKIGSFQLVHELKGMVWNWIWVVLAKEKDLIISSVNLISSNCFGKLHRNSK